MTYPEIKKFLDRAKTLVLPCEERPSVRALGKRLALEWAWFLIKYKKRSKLFEAYMTHGDDISTVFSLEYMSRGVTNLDSHLKQARGEFSDRFEFFLKCRIKPPSERRKHWPNPARSNAEIRAATSRVSSFRREFTVEDAYSGLYIVMAAFFDRIRAKQIKYVAVDFEHDIGYCKAEPCNYVLYELNYSGPEAHCYPVSQIEANEHKQVKLSDFWVEFDLNQKTLSTADD
jgi:hypothetical protein